MLQQQLNQFDEWKHNLYLGCVKIEKWLSKNNLLTEKNIEKLDIIKKSVSNERLTIAFVGEFSRGKTELINALLFSDYGQRILTSSPGRTTMCPSELLYDFESEQAYIQLLPIETRLQPLSLEQYRCLPKQWFRHALDVQNPEAMVEKLRLITETKKVTLSQAQALGFKRQDFHGLIDKEGYVEIPAWRHAIISYPHPMLKQGLCILDTPGLNALGSEPDLTLNQIPQAQAIVFMLAADAGVTASDLEIWNNHIKPLQKYPHVVVYAALNKIDYLWDELKSVDEIEQDLKRIIKTTATQLQLSRKEILPVSAQKAMVAKSKHDEVLLARSRLPHIEKMLSVSAFQNKIDTVQQYIVESLQTLLMDGRQILHGRKDQVQRQIQGLQKFEQVDDEEVVQLINTTRDEHVAYSKKLLSLKPSQRLIQRQTEILLELISQDKMEQLLTEITSGMTKSWTTLGISQGMVHFFDTIDGILRQVSHEIDLSNRMACSAYDKFQKNTGDEAEAYHQLRVKLLAPRRYQLSFARIRQETELYNSYLKLTLTEQGTLVRTFLDTTLNRTKQLFRHMRQELSYWGQEVMMPLVQDMQGHKQLLDQHIEQLQALKKNGASLKGRQKALEALLIEFRNDLTEADQIDMLIQNPAQIKSEQVVQLSARRN